MALRRMKSLVGNMVTAIAINKDKNSQFAVKWAMDNLVTRDNPKCILLHVQTRTLHPRDYKDGDPEDGGSPDEDELQKFFLPFRGFCARRGIVAKEVILYDLDIPGALVDYITLNSIGIIVIGASSKNAFFRKFRGSDASSCLLKSAPETCSVFVISKGKLQASRPASRPQTLDSNAVLSRQQSLGSLMSDTPPESLAAEETRRISSVRSNGDSPLMIPHEKKLKPNGKKSSNSSQWRSTESSLSGSFNRKSQSDGRSDNSSQRNSMESSSLGSFNRKSNSDGGSDNSSLTQGVISSASSSNIIDSSQLSFASSSTSEATETRNSFSSNDDQEHQRALEAEMRSLKLELRRTMELYTSVCREATSATERAQELQELRALEARRLEKARRAEEAALKIAEVERQKSQAAIQAAETANHLAEIEAQKRKYAEMKAKREEEERKKAEHRLAHKTVPYRRFTIEELELATDYFSSSQKIGEGGYGPVYKAVIDHTPVAIKVLRPDKSQGQRQFQQEVEVLSCMRHPNLVILLGACPEYGCLVYEYMENGTLEDRLFRRDNTPSLPWRTRFRVAAEIATALLFLHQAKPEPLVHRDLKPSNVLLDRNHVSKISDVGLARLIPSSVADSVTQYHLTAAAGTFCYIDPEYQRTGMLGVKSDLYSLGVVLLQIITARPPMGLSCQVEEAIEKGKFAEALDPTVPDWPVEEALSLAKLAVKCCELRKKDRPDLASVVVPELNRLRELGSEDEDEMIYISRPCKSVPSVGPPLIQVSH